MLGASGALLCLFLLLRVGIAWIAAIAGASVPVTYGLLAVYRDPWIWVASLVAVPALAVMLYLARRAPASPGSSGTHRSRQAVWAVVALTAALFLLYLGYMDAFDVNSGVYNNYVTVGQDEVNAAMARAEQTQGRFEYLVSEIFLSIDSPARRQTCSSETACPRAMACGRGKTRRRTTARCCGQDDRRATDSRYIVASPRT